MKFLKRFFQEVFSASVPTYDKKFYPTVVKREYGPALGYFLFFIFIISLVFAALAISGLRFAATEFTEKFETDIPDFQLSISDGIVTTNLPQPFIIPDLLVIDTTGTVTSLDNRTEPMLLTSNKLYIKENGVQTNVFELDEIDSLKITKDMLRSFIQSSKTGLFILAFVLILFGVWVGIGLWYFFYTLFFSVLAWLFVKGRLRFAKVHQISLYAITGPIIFIGIWNLFAPPTPYLFSVVFLGYFILALQNTKPTYRTGRHAKGRR